MNIALIGKVCIILPFLCILLSCHKKIDKTNTADQLYTDIKIDSGNNYLIAVFKDSSYELGSPFAFINLQKDTIIPFGKYSHCWTDTLRNFAIVYDSINTKGMTVAIDKNEHILFDIVFFDNWPDEIHDGLFRVKRNGKIGFANSKGEIIIPCQFVCAYGFENGRAKVAYHCTETHDDCDHTTPKSDAWFYIDTKGNKIL